MLTADDVDVNKPTRGSFGAHEKKEIKSSSPCVTNKLETRGDYCVNIYDSDVLSWRRKVRRRIQ